MLAKQCPTCGVAIPPEPKRPGNRRIYCSSRCRDKARQKIHTAATTEWLRNRRRGKVAEMELLVFVDKLTRAEIALLYPEMSRIALSHLIMAAHRAHAGKPPRKRTPKPR